MSAGPIGTCIARPRSRGRVAARTPAVTTASPNAGELPGEHGRTSSSSRAARRRGRRPGRHPTHRGRGEERDGEPPGTDHGRGEDRAKKPVGLPRHGRGDGKGNENGGGEGIDDPGGQQVMLGVDDAQHRAAAGEQPPRDQRVTTGGARRPGPRPRPRR